MYLFVLRVCVFMGTLLDVVCVCFQFVQGPYLVIIVCVCVCVSVFVGTLHGD